jgi:hypothetical protein
VLSTRKRSQGEVVVLLKACIDVVSSDHPDGAPASTLAAKRLLMDLLANERVHTTHVLHNIGVFRRRWLEDFLNGSKR